MHKKITKTNFDIHEKDLTFLYKKCIILLAFLNRLLYTIYATGKVATYPLHIVGYQYSQHPLPKTESKNWLGFPFFIY